MPLPRARKVGQPANRADWSNLQTVTKGTSIDVKLKSGELFQGLMESVDDTGLTVRMDSRLETIARDQIDHVSRLRTLAGEMAVAGAAGGGILGAVLGAEAGNDTNVDRIQLIGLGAVGGALGGAVAGAMTGLFQKQRIIVYFSR